MHPFGQPAIQSGVFELLATFFIRSTYCEIDPINMAFLALLQTVSKNWPKNREQTVSLRVKET